MGILNYNQVTEVSNNSFNIVKTNNNIKLTFNNGDYIEDTFNYILFNNKILELNFNSILLGGLGLGTIPQYIAENLTCETIDVIEIDSLLISTINNMGILDPKINIIEGDIFNYTPTKTYDLILFDIWWKTNETFVNIVNNLFTNYNSYLNPNGNIYFPLLYPNGIFPKDSNFNSIYYFY